MAADSLIDEYLAVFAERVARRRDHADLVDEVADHLHTASERLELLGVDPETAQRRALARFGEPRLVAGLITSVPTKGNVMSLFLSRRLGALSAVTAALWVVATVAGVFGNSEIAGGWTPERYLLSSVLIALACLATTGVLVGMNLRATGGLDAATVTIAAVGVLSAVAAALLSWVTVGWMTPLTVAVVWTLVRARRNHAGSRVFTTITLVGLPLVAVGAGIANVVAFSTDVWLDPIAWTTFLGLGVLLVAAFADMAVRLGRHRGADRAVVA